MGARYDADAFGRLCGGCRVTRHRAAPGRADRSGDRLDHLTPSGHPSLGPLPFILLDLAFSTQAAYAAPLILLAQNRQDDRDRANIDRDREVAARTQADTEFLARELAAVRLALADVVTTGAWTTGWPGWRS